jgi:hypothetical protein
VKRKQDVCASHTNSGIIILANFFTETRIGSKLTTSGHLGNFPTTPNIAGYLRSTRPPYAPTENNPKSFNPNKQLCFMSDEDEIVSVLLGLLDFDSDRATAHASFAVASIFGIYALLSAFEYFDSYYGKIVFGFTYILLAFLSLYSFLNFSKYASSAHWTRAVMKNNYLEGLKSVHAQKIKDELERKEEKKDIIVKFRDWLLDSETWRNWKMKVFFFAWLFAVSAPFVWIILFQ